MFRHTLIILTAFISLAAFAQEPRHGRGAKDEDSSNNNDKMMQALMMQQAMGAGGAGAGGMNPAMMAMMAGQQNNPMAMMAMMQGMQQNQQQPEKKEDPELKKFLEDAQKKATEMVDNAQKSADKLFQQLEESTQSLAKATENSPGTELLKSTSQLLEERGKTNLYDPTVAQDYENTLKRIGEGHSTSYEAFNKLLDERKAMNMAQTQMNGATQTKSIVDLVRDTPGRSNFGSSALGQVAQMTTDQGTAGQRIPPPANDPTAADNFGRGARSPASAYNAPPIK